MSQPDYLYHWTSFESAKLILKGKNFRIKYLLENKLDGSTFGFYVPMACFTELRIDNSVEHRELYGHTGIVLKKKWATANNLQPVSYVSSSEEKTRIHRSIIDITRSMKPKLQNPQFEDELLALSNEIRNKTVYNKFIPQVCGKEKTVKSDFYKEQEWRYTPMLDLLLSIAHPKAPLLPSFREDTPFPIEEINSDIHEYHTLKFTWDDIEHLVVSSSEEKKELMEVFSEIEKYKIEIHVHELN